MGNSSQVVVVGGGAAGLVAAVSAAKAGADVTVLEADKRVGQKILKTGNGRCNLTNSHITFSDYHNGPAIMPLLEAYPSSKVLGFFAELGLLVTEESEGRIYPLSNTANTVLDVLRDACKWNDVKVSCERKVEAIRKKEPGFELVCEGGDVFGAERVIVATGGGTDLLSSFGHVITPFAPMLCPLKTDTAPLKGLSGVRAHARVSAYRTQNDSEPVSVRYGEVLFRDYGLSGIVIFDMSRVVEEGYWLNIDFLPQLSPEQCGSLFAMKYPALRARANKLFGREPNLTELMCGCFHARVNDAIIRMAGSKPSDVATIDKLPMVAHFSKNFRIRVIGRTELAQAQVTRGGASPWEFDSLRLESRMCPGLFAAGETLDVDGRCGGFNLHWAWASGMAAGAAAATR